MKLNVEQMNCTMRKGYIGYDEVINFCTDNVYRVDWSYMDWSGMVFGISVIVVVIVGTIAICRL